MAMRSLFSISRTAKSFQLTRQCLRTFHQTSERASAAPSPSPTPFVPDVETFFKLIGRDMSKHASKIPSWEELFTMSSAKLREAGIEQARQRRYLIRKREHFRNGIYGPGGDLEVVVDGVAQLRVVEVPYHPSAGMPPADGPSAKLLRYSANLTPGTIHRIVNLAPDATEYTHDPSKTLKKFAHFKVYQGGKIMGKFLNPIKGSNNMAGLIKVQEGMWEDKRGHKVDGGERRQAEVRAKMRAEESKQGTA